MKFASLFISVTALFSAAYGSTTDSDEDFNPVLTGTYDNGVLHWVLTSEVGSASEVDTTQDDTTDNYEWKDTSGTVYFDDTEAAGTAYTVQNKNNKNYLYVPFAQSNSKLTYNFPDANASGDGPWTLSLKIYYIVSGDDMPTKEVTYTIEKPQPSKSSQSLSSSSTTQSSSSPVVSTGTPSTSTSSSTLSSSSILSNSEGSTTGNNVATTVITITSCADHICTKKPVTTGVTVCTTTENGVETIYTTYCPLSGAAPEIATPETAAPVTPVTNIPATLPATTLASVSQSQSYTPPAVATATGMAAAVEIKGAVFGAALVALGALM